MRKLKDLNWNHLYCFYEVARAQSLKRGALELGVASSTVSAQIKMLEEKFDTKLFNRSSKGLALTTEGVKLFERTKTVFEEGSKLLEHFSTDVVGGYPVSIGIEETISYDLATEFSSQYWDLYTPYGTVNTIRQADHEMLMDNLLQGNILYFDYLHKWELSRALTLHYGIGYALNHYDGEREKGPNFKAGIEYKF